MNKKAMSYLLFFSGIMLLSTAPLSLHAHNSASILSLFLTITGFYGGYNEYTYAEKKATREQKKYTAAKKQGRKLKKPKSFIWHLRPFQTFLYTAQLIVGAYLYQKKATTSPVLATPTIEPPVTPPLPITPKIETPTTESDYLTDLAIALVSTANIPTSDRNPKDARIQFNEYISNALYPTHDILDINENFIPYFKVFNQINPCALIGKESQDIDHFFTHKENLCKELPQLSAQEQNQMFLWVYRQYWNTQATELRDWLKVFTNQYAHQNLKNLIKNFITFLDNPQNLANEIVIQKEFVCCADQSDPGENGTADCGPFAVINALNASQNASPETFLNTIAYKAQNQEIRKTIITNSHHATIQRKKEMIDGELDSTELSLYNPLKESPNIIFLPIDQMSFIHQNNPQDLLALKDFDEKLAQALEHFKNPNDTIIFIINNGHHWLTIECKFNNDMKINVRAFDSSTSQVKSNSEKPAYHINHTNLTRTATVGVYFLTELLKKVTPNFVQLKS